MPLMICRTYTIKLTVEDWCVLSKAVPRLDKGDLVLY